MSLSSVPSMSITCGGAKRCRHRCDHCRPLQHRPRWQGFNQAVAACRAGADTHFVCALGDDAGGATARELAAHDGFALIAEASSEPTGTAIYVDARGRNTIVIGPGANAALGTDFLQQQQACWPVPGGAGAAGIAGADHRSGAGHGPRGRCHHRAQHRAGRCALDHRPAQAGRCDHPERDRVRRSSPCRRARGCQRRRGAGWRQPACAVPQAGRQRHGGGDPGFGGRVRLSRRREPARRYPAVLPRRCRTGAGHRHHRCW